MKNSISWLIFQSSWSFNLILKKQLKENFWLNYVVFILRTYYAYAWMSKTGIHLEIITLIIFSINYRKKSILILKFQPASMFIELFIFNGLKVSIPLTVIMAGSPIKLFQTVQKLNKTMGIWDIQNQKQTSKNHLQFIPSVKFIRKLFFILSTTQLFLSSTAFFLMRAQIADDFGLSFYVSLTTFCVMINFMTVAWKMNKFSMLIEHYEKFIEKS